MQAAFWVTHPSPLKLELLELRTRSSSWVLTLTFSVTRLKFCVEYTGCALRQQSLPAASGKGPWGNSVFYYVGCTLIPLSVFIENTEKFSQKEAIPRSEVVLLHGSSLKSLTPQNESPSSSVIFLQPNQSYLTCKMETEFYPVRQGFSRLHNVL